MSIAPLTNTSLIDTSVVDYISHKNSTKKNMKSQQLVDFIVSDLKQIPNILTLKNDLETILRICKIIENVVLKKDGINKIDIIIKVFSLIFNNGNELPPNDTLTLKSHVTFLLNTGDITKIKNVKKITKYVYNFISANFFL
jgi:hypothetical protein